MKTPNIQDIFSSDGFLSQIFPEWESRQPQIDMATLVDEAIEAEEHAIVEAPTGVGKSFAYLVPAARSALKTGKKIIISTGTIALQEQLINKDVPVLEKLFPGLKVVLVKGRQNYLSRRRLDYAITGQRNLFDNDDDQETLKSIRRWAEQSTVGDKADLGYEPERRIWNTVMSDSANCRGRRCPQYDHCFFYQARKEIVEADILIVNHHLYFSDLALRDEHAAILPAHGTVIFDEAHTLEDVATDHLGLHIAEGQIRYFLEGLLGRKGTGVLADTAWLQYHPAIEKAKQANENFWKAVSIAFGNRKDETMRIGQADFVVDILSDTLSEIGDLLKECQSASDQEDSAQEFAAHASRAYAFAGGLRSVLEQQHKDYVYYATIPRKRGSASLSAHPLSVHEQLKTLLFDRMDSVIVTSATLAADDSDRFLFLRRRLGIETDRAKRLDTPFNFQEQAKLLVNRSPLDPNSEAFEMAMAQWLGDFLQDSEGGTFVLFTSYRQLQRVHDLVRPRLDRARRFVLRHGEGIGRSQMLDLFKSTGDAVLFGTTSFWEGVDVRGNALKNVIITKLPFEVPNHPLVEARHNAISAKGGNPFMERTVPEAILRLKQGVGRLIRTVHDTGTIVLCDHRITTKRYGSYFLRALPDMNTTYFTIDNP